MEETIEEFLKSNNKSISIKMISVAEISSILSKLNYFQHEHNGDETNEWQVDFWYHFSNNDDDTKQIIFAGSLYHGNFTLTKDGHN